MQLGSIHHVTCVCSDAQRTTDFYRDELGFSLVKKTVNFDDPHSYHLYFGDEAASPGSLIAFFEWPRADAGRLGRGTLSSIGLYTPYVREETDMVDPDGLRLRLHPASRVGVRDVVAFGSPLLYAGLFDPEAPLGFDDPVDEAVLIGPGVADHVAWRVPDEAALRAWAERLTELGLRPTGEADRKYFRSISFRMPDGLLIEVATDGPGFLVDEAPTRLGQLLALPRWLEGERAMLERELVPIF